MPCELLLGNIDVEERKRKLRAQQATCLTPSKFMECDLKVQGACYQRMCLSHERQVNRPKAQVRTRTHEEKRREYGSVTRRDDAAQA